MKTALRTLNQKGLNVKSGILTALLLASVPLFSSSLDIYPEYSMVKERLPIVKIGKNVNIVGIPDGAREPIFIQGISKWSYILPSRLYIADETYLPKGMTETDVTYATKMIRWSRQQYRLDVNLNDGTGKGTFFAYSEITNGTKKNFSDSRISLKFGKLKLHTRSDYERPIYLSKSIAMDASLPAPMAKTQDFHGVYSYTFKRNITIPAESKTRILQYSRQVKVRGKEIVSLRSPFSSTKKEHLLPSRTIEFLAPETIPPGTFYIFESGVFIGSDFKNFATKKSKVKLSIGRDPYVTVKRVISSSKKIIGKNRWEYRAVERLKISNGHKTPIEITIKEDFNPLTDRISDYKGGRTCEFKKDKEGYLVLSIRIPPQKTVGCSQTIDRTVYRKH